MIDQMKKINLFLVLILTLLPVYNLSAQVETLDAYLNSPNYEVKIDADSVVEIYNKKTNLRWLKSIKEYNEPENARTADLIIDLDTVNLAYYEDYYRKWGRLNAANPSLGAEYIVVDANNNSKNEIYAVQSSDTTFFTATIYENVIDSLFNYWMQIRDSLSIIYDIGDITNDGLLDIICRKIGNQLYFYKQSSSTDYIDQLNFIYNPFPTVYQPNDVTFYDLTGDGIQEIIYYLDAGSIDSVWGVSNHVAMYNPVINNYELKYYHRPTPNFFTFGFATGDFDNDGKNNFSTGGINGNYFFYEYVAGNTIKLEYEMQLQTANAYQSLMTDDINNNGKNEIWIGSEFFSSQYGAVTRVFVLEPAGNETYEIVYQIDIRGLFSFIVGRLKYADLDGDGMKDIFLNNTSLCFGFKYSQERNYYLDFIIDIWEDDPGYQGQYFEGGDIADLDSDGIAEIIMQKSLYWPEQYKSLFWKRDKLAGIDDDDNLLPGEFNLWQNYPNPFNPQTTIKFSLPQEVKVNIKIYNIVGKEITQLINETRISGEYEVTWDGRDSNGNQMPSGVYFIALITETYNKTIKAILIK